MKRMFTLAAGAALTFALGCGGSSAVPTAPAPTGASEFTGPNAIVSLKIEAPTLLTVGDTAQVKVVATLAGGVILDVTAKALLSVTNDALATVSASGELRALAPGDCGLTALVGAVSANLNTQIRARLGNIVKLDIRGKVDLDLGEKTQLLAIATLDTGGELDVTAKASFSSGNDAVLRVSVSGLLEAVGAGTCDLLSIVDGIRASVKVNVKGRADDGPGEHIARLEIRGKMDLDLGEKTQLQAIALLNTGAERDVTAKASFTTGNDAVLRVSGSGQIEAVGAGTTDVQSITEGVRASASVNVRGGGGNGSERITKLEIRGKTNLDLGEKAQLQAIATLGTGKEVDVTAKAIFKSDNDAVLRVGPGALIEGIGIGAAVVGATVDGISASIPADVQLGAIVKLDIDGLADLVVGERLNVKVMGTNAHGIKVDVTSNTELSSADNSILRVNVGGIVEALGPGSCDLIAVHGGVRALVRLNVRPKAVVLVKLRIDGLNVLNVGQTALLKVFAGMSDNTEVDVTGKVSWSTDNGSCGLSLGILTGHAPGNCLISASLEGLSANLLVNVKANVLTIVKLRIEGLTILRLGQTAQLKAIATMSDNTDVDVTGRVSWSSSNVLSLLVNASGLLTALLPGDCLVTGVVDGIKATTLVKVTLL